MGIFLKVCGGVFLSLILVLVVGKNSKDFALVLSVMACCMVALAAMEYIRPILEFLSEIESMGELDHNMVRILLKVTGIGLITEICSLVCADSGSASLGKTMKIMGCSVMLWLSLPLYAMLVELLQRILGAL